MCWNLCWRKQTDRPTQIPSSRWFVAEPWKLNHHFDERPLFKKIIKPWNPAISRPLPQYVHANCFPLLRLNILSKLLTCCALVDQSWCTITIIIIFRLWTQYLQCYYCGPNTLQQLFIFNRNRNLWIIYFINYSPL